MSLVTSLVGGSLASAGAAVLWRARRRGWQHRAAARWPRVWGEVLHSEVREEPGSEHARYAPAVRYRYEVGGVAYTNARLRAGAPEWHRSHSGALARAEEYPHGRRKLVSYDPADPGLSVLEPHDRGGVYAAAAAGIALIVGGLVMLV